MKIAPFSAFQFFFYDFYKANLFSGKPKDQLNYGEKLICGAVTGMTASFLTYPMDIVKTYLVVAIENEATSKRTVMDQFKIIIGD